MCRSSPRDHWRKIKERKRVTSRIVTKGDIESVLSAIENAHQNEQINDCHYQNYRAIVLFGAFTGQRPQATTARLTVGQFRTTISQKRPVIDVLPKQDKIRMQHYCPLHRQVVDAVGPRFISSRTVDKTCLLYQVDSTRVAGGTWPR